MQILFSSPSHNTSHSTPPLHHTYLTISLFIDKMTVLTKHFEGFLPKILFVLMKWINKYLFANVLFSKKPNPPSLVFLQRFFRRQVLLGAFIAIFRKHLRVKVDRLKLEDTYWPMKWQKLLHHCSGFRNVGEGFLKQNHTYKSQHNI